MPARLPGDSCSQADRDMKLMLGAGVLAFSAVLALAKDAVPTEVSTPGTATITLHLHGFLSAEELQLLRLVAANTDALLVFVPGSDGYAGLAVSPDDGFIRDGVPVASAVAISGLPDAETAQRQALAACDAARGGTAPCVIVLQISPAG